MIESIFFNMIYVISVPVVGVAAGGLVELIEDAKTGFLVSNNDKYAELCLLSSKLLYRLLLTFPL